MNYGNAMQRRGATKNYNEARPIVTDSLLKEQGFASVATKSRYDQGLPGFTYDGAPDHTSLWKNCYLHT